MKKRFALLLTLAVFGPHTTLSLAGEANPPAITNASRAMPPTRPLFFKDLAAFDTDKHRSLTLQAERLDFSFAAAASMIPITVAEAGLALRHYPLVFVPEGDERVLVALTGLPGAGNAFIDAQGTWRAGQYIPAYVRGYPFITVRTAPEAEPLLAFDPSASEFKPKDGLPLLDGDGKPTEAFKGVIAFQMEYRQHADRTQAMVSALKDAGVLEEGNLHLQPSNGGEAQKIGGFLIVSEAKLRGLSPEALKKLMEADALGLAYAQMFSMASLGNLFQPATPPNQKAAAPANGKTSTGKRSKQKD